MIKTSWPVTKISTTNTMLKTGGPVTRMWARYRLLRYQAFSIFHASNYHIISSIPFPGTRSTGRKSLIFLGMPLMDSHWLIVNRNFKVTHLDSQLFMHLWGWCKIIANQYIYQSWRPAVILMSSSSSPWDTREQPSVVSFLEVLLLSSMHHNLNICTGLQQQTGCPW